MSRTEPIGIVLRDARPEDAPGIAAVHVEAWRSTYAGLLPREYLLQLSIEERRVMWQRQVRANRYGESILVAEARGAERARIIGFGSCGPARRGSVPASGEIYTLYVGSDWQGRGVGHALLSELLARLYSFGHAGAYLWVLAGNHNRFFYEAQGAERAGRRMEPFAGERVEEAAYRWPNLAAWLAREQTTGG